MSNSLNSNFETMFSKMEVMVSSKTVIGEAIHIGDVIILPLVDVSFGLGAGNFDNDKEKDKKQTGGGGIGASVSPSAVLVIEGGNVQLVNIKNQDSINKLIDMAPGVLSKLNISSWFKKEEEEPVKEFFDEE
jgi:uncharacterized spore protein YtfJ